MDVHGMRVPGFALACVLAGVAVSFSYVLLDVGPLTGHHDHLRIVIETTVAIVAAIATLLSAARFVRSRSRSDLFLACALSVLAGAAVVAWWTPPSGPVVGAVWHLSWLRAGAAGFLIAAAFVGPERVRRREARLWAASGVSMLGIGIVFGTGIPRLRGWSRGAIAHVTDAVAAWESLVLLEWAGCVAFAVAAVAFFRTFVRSRDGFMLWLTAALTMFAFARVETAGVPAVHVDVLRLGDLLRVAAFGLLLAGTLWEINRYWRRYATDAIRVERRHLAREIHDGVAQEAVYLAVTARELAQGDARPELTRMIEAADRAVDESRMVMGTLVRPAAAPLADVLIEAAERVAGRAEARVHAVCDRSIRVSPALAEPLARIVRESVNNAVRHGQADRIELELSVNGQLQVEVRDNGSGFDTTKPCTGFGLVSMRERAELLGGHLVVSSELGQGTSVAVRVHAGRSPAPPA